jgi:hypothetical protein
MNRTGVYTYFHGKGSQFTINLGTILFYLQGPLNTILFAWKIAALKLCGTVAVELNNCNETCWRSRAYGAAYFPDHVIYEIYNAY